MGWRRWGGMAWICALAGCPTDATTTGVDSYGDATGGAETTGGPPNTMDTGESTSPGPPADSDADECPETHACIAPVPDGWDGPVALFDDAAAACPNPYPAIELDGFEQAVGAAARCTCECDASSLCGPLIGSDIASTCEFPSPVLDATEFARPEACEPISPIDGGGFHLGFEPDPLGQCEPSASSVVPEPTTSGRLLACGDAALPLGCEGGSVCAPLVDANAIGPCILRTGTHECPAEYPVARTAWTGMLDERACSPCGCAANDGPPTCDATVRISSTEDCESPAVPDFDIGAFACVPNDGSALSFLRYTDVTALVSGCMPSGGTAIGSVSPVDPVTICCT